MCTRHERSNVHNVSGFYENFQSVFLHANNNTELVMVTVPLNHFRIGPLSHWFHSAQMNEWTSHHPHQTWAESNTHSDAEERCVGAFNLLLNVWHIVGLIQCIWAVPQVKYWKVISLFPIIINRVCSTRIKTMYTFLFGPVASMCLTFQLQRRCWTYLIITIHCLLLLYAFSLTPINIFNSHELWEYLSVVCRNRVSTLRGRASSRC